MHYFMTVPIILLAACHHRYHSPIARTTYLSKNPPDKQSTLADHTVEGLNLILKTIKLVYVAGMSSRSGANILPKPDWRRKKSIQ
jgi:hypothetical protein